MRGVWRIVRKVIAAIIEPSRYSPETEDYLEAGGYSAADQVADNKRNDQRQKLTRAIRKGRKRGDDPR